MPGTTGTRYITNNYDVYWWYLHDSDTTVHHRYSRYNMAKIVSYYILLNGANATVTIRVDQTGCCTLNGASTLFMVQNLSKQEQL